MVIELGNLFIHQSELQRAADAAVVAGSKKWKNDTDNEVAVANGGFAAKQIVNKNIDTSIFEVKIFTHFDNDNFYLKLEEKVPPIFVKVFGDESFTLTAYAAASKSSKKLISFATPVADNSWMLYSS